MSNSGHADLPLHYGRVPPWLASRMALLAGALTESILTEYGKEEFLRKLSNPGWFQSFGAVLGMDWHSSGITTSVMGALKKALAPRSEEWGIYVCGGRGKHSRKTPHELLEVADKTGLDGYGLAKSSRLVAKIDNTTIQDGFQVYLHNFIVTSEGNWAVIQQGMNKESGMARRYHWNSMLMDSYLSDPHTSVCGINQGMILNLVHQDAQDTQQGILSISREKPYRMLNEIKSIKLPENHEVLASDVNLRRLGAVIALAHENGVEDFESLLLTEGLGPRTLQSLTLVSEVIHGTPSRFEDPARFSFAHGGKDGHPFPVITKVYDETIEFLHQSLHSAKLGHTVKKEAFKKLHSMAKKLEKGYKPDSEKFQEWIEKEKSEASKYGGRTVFDKFDKKRRPNNGQLKLF